VRGAFDGVVMAHRATIRHLGHFSVTLVVEGHGQIQVGQFIQYNQIRAGDSAHLLSNRGR
jgi:hypothetical protein